MIGLWHEVKVHLNQTVYITILQLEQTIIMLTLYTCDISGSNIALSTYDSDYVP